MTKRILALLCLLALAGCASQDPDESSIPWSRPHSWENTAPGFGGVGGGGY